MEADYNLDEVVEKLRWIDRIVLSLIGEGAEDTRDVRDEISASRRKVEYCTKKLERLDLIDRTKQDGYMEEVIDGQKRVFKAPNSFSLTMKGRGVLEYEEFQVSDDAKTNYRELTDQISALVTQIEKYNSKAENNAEILERAEKRFKFDRILDIYDDIKERTEEIKTGISSHSGGSTLACFICGEDAPAVLQEHHIVPKRFGGRDVAQNTVTLCANCHQSVERMYDRRFYTRISEEMDRFHVVEGSVVRTADV